MHLTSYLQNYFIRFIYFITVLLTCPFLLLWNTHFGSMDIGSFPVFLLLSVKLLWTFLHMSFVKHFHWIYIYTQKQNILYCQVFSQSNRAHLYPHQHCKRVSVVSRMNTPVFLNFLILVVVWRCLIEVLTYTSLMIYPYGLSLSIVSSKHLNYFIPVWWMCILLSFIHLHCCNYWNIWIFLVF